MSMDDALAELQGGGERTRALRRADLRRRLPRSHRACFAGAGAPSRAHDRLCDLRLRGRLGAHVVGGAGRVDSPFGSRRRRSRWGARFDAPCGDARGKARAFADLYWLLRDGSEEELLRVSLSLCAQAGVEPRPLTSSLCLDWRGARATRETRACHHRRPFGDACASRQTRRRRLRAGDGRQPRRDRARAWGGRASFLLSGRRPGLGGKARVRSRARPWLRQRGDHAARHDLRRASRSLCGRCRGYRSMAAIKASMRSTFC